MKICDIVTRFLSMGFTQSPTGQTLSQVSGDLTQYENSFSIKHKTKLTQEMITLLDNTNLDEIKNLITEP